MERQELTTLAARLERLADLATEGLERQMADPESDPRRARELTAVLKDVLGLARELRGGESQELTVRFLDGSGEASM